MIFQRYEEVVCCQTDTALNPSPTGSQAIGGGLSGVKFLKEQVPGTPGTFSSSTE